MKFCSASSTEPGDKKPGQAKFSVLPLITATAVRRESTAANIIESVAPPDCPTDASRLGSTRSWAASTSNERMASQSCNSEQVSPTNNNCLPGTLCSSSTLDRRVVLVPACG